jgi:hypothetical protein
VKLFSLLSLTGGDAGQHGAHAQSKYDGDCKQMISRKVAAKDFQLGFEMENG